MLAHVAEAPGIIAAETIAGAPTLGVTDYTMMPRVTLCQPQVASFGLTEAQARADAAARGSEIAVAKFPFRANGKAYGYGDPTGFAKVIADRARGAARRAPGRRRRRRAVARAHLGAALGSDRRGTGPQCPHPPDIV